MVSLSNGAIWMRGYEASPGSSILVEVVPYKCVLGGE
jgi:hypothetical protein